MTFNSPDTLYISIFVPVGFLLCFSQPGRNSGGYRFLNIDHNVAKVARIDDDNSSGNDLWTGEQDDIGISCKEKYVRVLTTNIVMVEKENIKNRHRRKDFGYEANINSSSGCGKTRVMKTPENCHEPISLHDEDVNAG